MNKELIFSYPVKDSKKVDNIVPWLAKDVVEAGGIIVIIKEGSVTPQADVVAKLRY